MAPLLFRLLLFICYLMPAALSILYPGISRRGISFGIAIPTSEWNGGPVRALRKSWRRTLAILSGLLFLPVCWFLFAGDLNSPVTALVFTAAILLQTLLTGICYLVWHRRMRRIKETSGWEKSARLIAMASTEGGVQTAAASGFWLLPMPLIALATAAFGLYFYDRVPDMIPMHFNAQGVADRIVPKSATALLVIPLGQLFLSVTFFFAWLSIRLSKQQLDPDAPEESLAQNRRFRRAWSAFLVRAGIAMTLMFVPIQLTMMGMLDQMWFIVGIVLTTVLILADTVRLSLRYGQGGSRAGTVKTTDGTRIDRNDDRFWKLGSFYWNPEDPALFVEKRFGIGWTMNYARPLAWIATIGLLALTGGFIAAMLLMGG